MSTSVAVLLQHKGSIVFSVPPTITVAAAAKVMDSHKIGATLVLEGDRLVGIFTERDVLSRVVAAGLDPATTPMSRVMTPQPTTITSATTIDEVMEMFTTRRFRHLPVVDDGRLVGMVSIGDVLRRLVETHRHEAEQLKQYISGGYPP